MTTLADRPNTALLVVDVQQDVVANAHNRDGVVANIVGLIDRARQQQVPVVWVQHNDDGLVRGSQEWQLGPELKRDDGEPLVEKQFGDAFEDTELEACWADSVSAGSWWSARRPINASGRPCTARSCEVTTRRSSATRTRRTTTRNGAHRRRTR